LLQKYLVALNTFRIENKKKLLFKLSAFYQAEDHIVASYNADGAYLVQQLRTQQQRFRSTLVTMGYETDVKGVEDHRKSLMKFRHLVDEHFTALDMAVRHTPKEKRDHAFTKTRAFLQETARSLVKSGYVIVRDVTNADILYHGVVELVTTEHIHVKPFPETFMLDFERFKKVYGMFHKMVLFAGVLITVWQRMHELGFKNPTGIIGDIVQRFNSSYKQDLASMVVVVENELRISCVMGDFNRMWLCSRLLQDGMLTGVCDLVKARFKNILLLGLQGGVHYTNDFKTSVSTTTVLKKFKLPTLLVALAPLLCEQGMLLNEMVFSNINVNIGIYASLIAESVKIVGKEEVDPKPQP
jgi:hypothetical protein